MAATKHFEKVQNTWIIKNFPQECENKNSRQIKSERNSFHKWKKIILLSHWNAFESNLIDEWWFNLMVDH